MNCLYSYFWVVAIHPDPRHNVGILFRTGERLSHRPCSSWRIAGFASTIHWEISQAENWRYERKWFQDVSVLNLLPNQFIEYVWKSCLFGMMISAWLHTSNLFQKRSGHGEEQQQLWYGTTRYRASHPCGKQWGRVQCQNQMIVDTGAKK